jgi:antitoxin (DNA-binding transcriptional repressor) of toxin-antitoxin stability system
MNTQIIGIKQLHSTLKKVASAALMGQSFLVVKNSKPVFKIEPVKSPNGKKYNLKDFSAVKFFTKDKNLSKKIDQIMYN